MSDEFVNSLDVEDNDEPIDNSTSEIVEPLNIQEPQQSEELFDLTKELLTLQGIKDINKIKFEDESGAVVEKSWNDLTNEEKVMILSNQDDPETSLDDSEIKLINLIRNSGLSPEQFISNLSKTEAPVPVYKVDELSDDELFCLDLLDKMGENADDITEEELQQAVDNAKLNKSLFDKQVASLRVYYKDAEIRLQLQKELEEQQAAERDFEVFQDNIINAISNFNASETIPVELSKDDMEDLASYILDRDQTGYSEFGKLLNDPALFTIAAFWMRNADKLMNEMQKLIKEAYLRGYNETHKDEQKTKVFAKPSSQKSSDNQESKFAYFDEDSYLTD